MTRDEAFFIIHQEGLQDYIYNQEHMQPNTVAIREWDGKWMVYLTDDDCSVLAESVCEFPSEELALNTFIRKLQIHNEIMFLKRTKT